jgi:protein Mpv17
MKFSYSNAWRRLFQQQKRGSSSAASQEIPTSFGRLLWDSYCQCLHQNPLATKASMAAVIFFSSDSSTQYIMKEKDEDFKWNASRSLSGASFGIVATTWLHFWWGFLETAVGKRIPIATHRLANTLTKVFFDQVIGAPCYIYTYYVMTNFLESLPSGKDPRISWKENNDKAREMLMPTMRQHWTLWPAVHSFNFYFVPLQHRVLLQNTILVGWSGYLSHLNNTGELMTPEEEVKVAIIRRDSLRAMHPKELKHPVPVTVKH